MAFVVVQHLAPTHKGMLVELLQRVSAMPVVEVQDRSKVEVDHVYVIPPNKDMSVLHGVLHLLPRPRGLNLPIDFFFRSLADDQGERSIGVLLSGMGTDGTQGLRAIKERAGVGFVQAPASAKFDSMPRSAIEAGLADVVAPVEELPGSILEYIQRPRATGRLDAPLDEVAESALEKVFVLLRAQTGNDFSRYKRSTIYRRVERRMGVHQLAQVEKYVRLLRDSPEEVELLAKELLIGVTHFFREPEVWDQLRSELMVLLGSTRHGSAPVRAWVLGCSTGEEAYSLAMVFKEATERLGPFDRRALQVFATDLDGDAIEKARSGLFPATITADVSPERLKRFFVQEELGYRVSSEIRQMVVFARHNVLTDPPFTKLDLLSCRNLLIYLSAELQKRLIPLFHYCLNPSGLLLLGSAETIGQSSALFTPLEGKARLHRRLQPVIGAAPVDLPAWSVPMAPAGETKGEASLALGPRRQSLQTLADRAIVQRLASPVVLTTETGDILYIGGKTGQYLEPAVGKTNINVFAMAREGLRHELGKAFSAARRGGKLASAREVQVRSLGGALTVDVTVEPLDEPSELKGTMLITFTEVPKLVAKAGRAAARRQPASARLAELEKSLRLAHEELQSTREAMQASQEALQSTNEEYQSANEELQSTNEELTTSKEEMQSMNEELQTVNHELEAKVEELSQSSNDMKNLLNSTDIATLFLDADLKVRRFTPQAAKVIKLIPGDAGRPFTDLTTALDYPELADDASEVLRTLVFKEKTVAASGERWFSVRIMPYRTQENVIDGLVITFTDASVSKALEAALRKQEQHLSELADSLPQLVWSSAADGAVDSLSRQWLEYTGVSELEQLGHGWLQQVAAQDRERVRLEWSAAVQSGAPFDSEFRIRRADGAVRWFKARAARVRVANGQVLRWYGTSVDIEDLLGVEEARRKPGEQAMSILESLSDAVLSLDDALVVTYANAAAERLLGRERFEVLGKPSAEAFPDGALVEEKCRQVLRDRSTLAFETRALQVQVVPRGGGLSVILKGPEPAVPAPMNGGPR